MNGHHYSLVILIFRLLSLGYPAAFGDVYEGLRLPFANVQHLPRAS